MGLNSGIQANFLLLAFEKGLTLWSSCKIPLQSCLQLTYLPVGVFTRRHIYGRFIEYVFILYLYKKKIKNKKNIYCT